MLNTPEALQTLIARSPWPQAHWTTLTVPDSAPVFALSVETAEAEACWQWWRERLSETGRWPLLTMASGWSGLVPGSWEKRVQEANLLNRWSYEHEAWRQPGDAISPTGLVAEALHGSSETVFQRLREDYPPEEDAWEGYEAEATVYGANGPDYLDWFQPGPTDLHVLLLLPTVQGWAAPAWIHWFGAERCHSESVLTVLRHWEQTHGAELVAHYGTMLQLQTPAPVKDLTAAQQLAEEQELLAPCTLILPGVSPAEHAQTLMQINRWFLHERP
ncbi:MAG: DUF4253 domain-containing protein [Candidatus Sericytochromatia bacterium]